MSLKFRRERLKPRVLKGMEANLDMGREVIIDDKATSTKNIFCRYRKIELAAPN